jgi:hypothetical protein
MLKQECEWCSDRDSNPGLRLERPEYLTGLYYRSTSFEKSTTKILTLSNKPYPSTLGLVASEGSFFSLNKNPVI